MWGDGTSHLLFEPLEFLEKLTALTPRPRINLILYHGVLAPPARWRSRIVPGPPLEPAASPGACAGASHDATGGGPRPARQWPRAELVTIEDPRIMEQILTHLGLPREPVRADPAQPPPASAADLFEDTRLIV